MPKTRVLVVAKEGEVQDLIMETLNPAYRLRTAPSEDQVLRILWLFDPDLLVFDADLSARSMALLTTVREERREDPLPVLALSRDRGDKVLLESFRAGADDFLVVPFKPVELAARVGALLRRLERAAAKPARLELGGVVLDGDAHGITVANRPVELTRIEFLLLEQLMNAAGKMLTKEKLILSAWGSAVDIRTHTLDSHIFNLRRKLGKHAALIRTFHGLGYSFRA